MDGTAETIAAMGEMRAKMETALAYGRAGGLFDARASVMTYLDALRECPLARPDLERARGDLEGRLGRGMAAPDGAGVDDLFLRLLRRYEAVCDALDLMACRVRLTIRLGRAQALREGGRP